MFLDYVTNPQLVRLLIGKLSLSQRWKNTQKTGEYHTKILNIRQTTVWNAEHHLWLMAYHQRPTSNDEGRPKQRTVAVALLFRYLERICVPPALGGPCLPLYRAGRPPGWKKARTHKVCFQTLQNTLTEYLKMSLSNNIMKENWTLERKLIMIALCEFKRCIHSLPVLEKTV